jgi:hypothetical protein
MAVQHCHVLPGIAHEVAAGHEEKFTSMLVQVVAM